MLLHSMAFLWSQSSGFEPNFRNQARKADFRAPVPARLAALEKHQKWPKNAVFGYIPLMMVSNGKNSYISCLGGVLGHLEAKTIKKNFDF